MNSSLFWSVGLVHPFGLGFVFGQAGLINRNNINIRRRDPEQKRKSESKVSVHLCGSNNTVKLKV